MASWVRRSGEIRSPLRYLGYFAGCKRRSAYKFHRTMTLNSPTSRLWLAMIWMKLWNFLRLVHVFSLQNHFLVLGARTTNRNAFQTNLGMSLGFRLMIFVAR